MLNLPQVPQLPNASLPRVSPLYFFQIIYKVIFIFKNDYSFVRILNWINSVAVEEDSNAYYPLVLSILLFILAELMLFVSLFWLSYHNFTSPFMASININLWMLTLSSFYGANWLMTLPFSILNDIDGLLILMNNDIYFYITQLHNLHIMFTSIIYARVYWAFVDVLWLYICVAYIY